MVVWVEETVYKVKVFYFFVDKKHREKAKSTGNFVLMGAWQP